MNKKLSNHLLELGVESVYFCAGSRNSLLLEDLKKFNVKYHFDERVNSFRALGEAKLTKKPVVICVTSGTAVSECYSALIEAFYSGEKLIVITADRPSALRFSHAPQAIDQINIFAGYTRSQVTAVFGSDFENINIEYPYQINIEIGDVNTSKQLPGIDLFRDIESMKPIIVCTEGDISLSTQKTLAQLGIPVFIESIANFSKGLSFNEYHNEFDVIRDIKNGSIDLILKLGKTPLCKLWRLLDTDFFDIPVFSINNSKTGLSRGETLVLSEAEFKELFKNINYSPVISSNLKIEIQSNPNSEVAKMKNIQDSIEKGSYIYLGNSMPIRNMETIYSRDFKYFANRGANGIDGQISTAIGMALATKKQVHCFVGDLTFLYDLNSLVKDVPENLFVYIINNKGGRIFERVNAAAEMILEHDIDLTKIINGLNGNILEIVVSNAQTSAFWKSVDERWI